MEVSVETLFDRLGKRYEDYFADSPNLQAFIQQSTARLPPKSRVLDVGCGTGRPVSEILASADHDVHGIDVSQEMVRIARSQVRGTFQKADMRFYAPHCSFNGVFAILSLFQITPGEIYSMCFRFSEWLEPGGLVVLGVTPSTILPQGQYVHDQTWDCTRQLRKPWMGSYTNETFFSEEGWRRLLTEAGFAIEEETTFMFTPKDSEHKTPEAHHLVLGRKVEPRPAVLGPFPLPQNSGPSRAATASDRHLGWDNLISKDLDVLLTDLKSRKTLYWGLESLGNGHLVLGAQRSTKPFDSLAFPDRHFDAVLAAWKLEHPLEVSNTVKELVRMTKRSSTNAEILMIQGAPDSEAARIVNSISPSSIIPHQGQLLHLAMEELPQFGFGNISLHRISARYEFPHESMAERCRSASEVLADFGYTQESHRSDSKGLLDSRLQLHFKGSAHSIGQDMFVPIRISEYHGFDGPLHTGWPWNVTRGAATDIINRITTSIVLPYNPDANGGRMHGFVVWPLTVDGTTGIRSDAARSYYLPAKNRPNLHLFLGAMAKRLSWASNHTASLGLHTARGVELVDSTGENRTIYASKEVIVSLGAMRTPGFLEHSGIGHPQVLRKHSVRPKVNLPGVGHGLNDQPNNGLAYSFTGPEDIFTGFPPYALYPSAHDVFGDETASIADAIGQEIPSYASRLVSYTGNTTSQAAQEALLHQQIKTIFDNGNDRRTPSGEILIYTNLQFPSGQRGLTTVWLWPSMPFGKGSIHTNSTDPTAYPAIDYNFLDFEANIIIQAGLLNYTRRLFTTAPFVDFHAEEVSPGFDVVPANGTVDDWRNWILQTAYTNSHEVGTAAMKDRKLGGVVDSRLKVYGTRNVRVVDASIWPTQLSGYPTATCYMIAEKAADMIKEDA